MPIKMYILLNRHTVMWWCKVFKCPILHWLLKMTVLFDAWTDSVNCWVQMYRMNIIRSKSSANLRAWSSLPEFQAESSRRSSSETVIYLDTNDHIPRWFSSAHQSAFRECRHACQPIDDVVIDIDGIQGAIEPDRLTSRLYFHVLTICWRHSRQYWLIYGHPT